MSVSVSSRVDLDKNLENYLLEPNQKLLLDKGPCEGKSVVLVDVNVLPIVNFMQKAQWLQKDTVVGTLETIEQIDERPIGELEVSDHDRAEGE